MRILAVTSGRADATPMGPVVAALAQSNAEALIHRTDGLEYPSLEGVICHLEAAICSDLDAVLLLGDRYEALAAALTATVAQVPIAHIHGGEASFGSFDNQIRDAITKLAHIHFVAHESFANRLVSQLGEDVRHIHVVGAPGLDNLTDLPPRKPEKYFVVTYHPATLEKGSGIHALVKALDSFPEYDAIWTGVNNDPGSDLVRDALSDRDVRILDPGDYIRLCRNAAAVVGNSSSGIIEAPTLQVPTVNVKPRQDGRLKGPSVIDCFPHEIETALRMALEYEGPYDNPYGGPGASKKIAAILSTAEIDMVKSW